MEDGCSSWVLAKGFRLHIRTIYSHLAGCTWETWSQDSIWTNGGWETGEVFRIFSYCNSTFASWSEYVTTHTQASYLEEMFVYFMCINVIAQWNSRAPYILPFCILQQFFTHIDSNAALSFPRVALTFTLHFLWYVKGFLDEHTRITEYVSQFSIHALLCGTSP